MTRTFPMNDKTVEKDISESDINQTDNSVNSLNGIFGPATLSARFSATGTVSVGPSPRPTLLLPPTRTRKHRSGSSEAVSLADL